MTEHRILAMLVLLGSLAITGCGNGLATVDGTVTLDGATVQGGPQMSAMINFVHEDGRGTPSMGVIDSSGHYSLKTGGNNGTQPGSYLVGITVQKITPPTARESMPQATLVSPAKYGDITQSGFRADVKPGHNTFDFNLSSTNKK